MRLWGREWKLRESKDLPAYSQERLGAKTKTAMIPILARPEDSQHKGTPNPRNRADKWDNVGLCLFRVTLVVDDAVVRGDRGGVGGSSPTRGSKPPFPPRLPATQTGKLYQTHVVGSSRGGWDGDPTQVWGLCRVCWAFKLICLASPKQRLVTAFGAQACKMHSEQP